MRRYGEKCCVIWSSAGPVVQRGSTFQVYCTFTFDCTGKGSKSGGCSPTKEQHQVLNSTTIYFQVVNITGNRTHSCECGDHKDPCGLDISAGYPPDHPQNISCIYKILNNDSGVVVCTWNKGKDSGLWNHFKLWVRIISGNLAERPKSFGVSNSRGKQLSANFNVSRSVQLISVWVQASNPLGTANSSVINYTLTDIAMPEVPVLGQPDCSSRRCIIKMEQSVRTQYLEMQLTADQQTWTLPVSEQRNSSHVWTASTLEPYSLYYFRIRSKFSSGLWSLWSTTVFSWTQEEVPAKEPDVWFAEPASDSKSLRVYWKEANVSITRGKIIAYEVYSRNFSDNVSADTRNYSVPYCYKCDVTVWAHNSKGPSPPARITTRYTKARPLQDVQVLADHDSVAISWRKPETAPLPTAYVLEWYPQGQKLEELRWVRLGNTDSRAVISDILPFECYEGALFVFYNETSVSRTTIKGVATSQSVPKVGPSVQRTKQGNNVEITWSEVPRDQRMGCIINYTIYLEANNGHKALYSVPTSERKYVINDLKPAEYSVWMTASTTKGEGPAGPPIKFYIEEGTDLTLPIVGGIVCLFLVITVCLMQNPTVQQRFKKFFECLKLDDVPDPANSKWGKEYAQKQGDLSLQLPTSNNSESEEEKLILTNVEELPKQNKNTPTTTTTFSSLLSHNTSLSPDTEPTALTYPQITYIKSFFHDSDTSDHTQTCLDTTVDYISSHGPENVYEEDEEDGVNFFSSPITLMEPLAFVGKLTLDTIKIDCSELFQNA
ncbi:interleukin-12 receptor subunit beta-2 isoform 2-T2 [Pholidichthys leucotaenia]